MSQNLRPGDFSICLILTSELLGYPILTYTHMAYGFVWTCWIMIKYQSPYSNRDSYSEELMGYSDGFVLWLCLEIWVPLYPKCRRLGIHLGGLQKNGPGMLSCPINVKPPFILWKNPIDPLSWYCWIWYCWIMWNNPWQPQWDLCPIHSHTVIHKPS